MSEKTLIRLGSWLLMGLAFFVFFVLFALIPQPVVQPIQFNHEKHLSLGMECLACHTGALENITAGIPTIQVCANCHSAELDNPPTPPELAKALTRSAEVEWKQVHRVPPHVRFSHRRHAALAKLACSLCHGEVAEKKEAFDRPFRDFSMGECMQCHRQKKVTTDCLACHK